MHKKDITREDFSSSLLKNIIIRADYQNLTDINGFINFIKGNTQLDLASKFNGSKIVSSATNVEEPSSNNIFRFFDSKIEPIQDVKLDISINAIILSIECNKNYRNIDSYLDLMRCLCEKLKEYDSFVDFKRIAIRKVDAQDFENLNDAYNVFERQRFSHDKKFQSMERITCKYIGEEQFLTNNVDCILKRSVEAFPDVYRFALDIDTNYNPNIIEKNINTNDIDSILRKLNQTIFDILKEFVTEEFLTNGINPEKK